MASRVATAGTYNSGDLISAADINAMPGGTIGRDTLAGNSAGTTTTEVILSVTVTVGDSREITIRASGNFRATTATEGQFRIRRDGVQLERKNVPIPATATDVFWAIEILDYPTAGSHTYDIVTGEAGTGSATVTVVGDGATGSHGQAQMRVVDSGPAF